MPLGLPLSVTEIITQTKVVVLSLEGQIFLFRSTSKSPHELHTHFCIEILFMPNGQERAHLLAIKGQRASRHFPLLIPCLSWLRTVRKLNEIYFFRHWHQQGDQGKSSLAVRIRAGSQITSDWVGEGHYSADSPGIIHSISLL